MLPDFKLPCITRNCTMTASQARSVAQLRDKLPASFGGWQLQRNRAEPAQFLPELRQDIYPRHQHTCGHCYTCRYHTQQCDQQL